MTRLTRVLLLLFAVSLSVGIFVYDVIPQCAVHSCAGSFAGIYTSPAPYKYRVLNFVIPALMVSPEPTESQLMLNSLVLHTLCFIAIYSGLYIWLKRWSDENRALIGMFMFVAFLPLAFHIYAVLIASILEVALLLWALILIDRYRWMVVIVAIAALNRETAIFLVLAYVVFYPSQWKRWGGLGLIYAAITAGLHLWLGPSPHVLGFEGTLAYNLETISNAIFVNLMITPLWILVALNYRHAPVVLKRLCWVALLYAGSIVVAAAWEESRLMMLMFPLVLPIVVSSLRQPIAKTAQVPG